MNLPPRIRLSRKTSDWSQLVDADMGVVEPKLIEGQEEAQAEALRAAGIRATVCIPDNISPLLCEAYPGPSDIDVRVEAMKESLRRFAPFKPEVVVVVTGYDRSFDPKDARKIAVEGLREAARTAAELGIDLSLEPIRPDLGEMEISIPHSLRETEEWLDEIGEPNVGICLDVFNVFRTENWIEDSERLAGGDCPRRPSRIRQSLGGVAAMTIDHQTNGETGVAQADMIVEKDVLIPMPMESR